MADRARIQSVGVLKDVKAAVIEFADTVGATLTSVDAEVSRITQWLNHQVGYWKREVRRREDEVNKRKMDIARKRLTAAPEPASVVEEQKALNKARAGLEHAQRKLESTRRWAPVWEREALLYKTATSSLSEALNRDVPAAASRLERMMRSLDEYAAMAPPPGDDQLGPRAAAEGGGGAESEGESP